MNTPAAAPLRGGERVGMAAWAALLILQLVWYLWLRPPRGLPPWLVSSLTALPLSLPLLALRRPRRALLWAGIVALFYFCHGVAEAWSASEGRWLAALEIALAVLLIGGMGASVRRPRR